MGTGGGAAIQAMISVMKNNSSLLRAKARFKARDGSRNYYNGKIKERHFSEEEVAQTKAAFKKDIKRSNLKTIVAWLLTIILTPLLLYVGYWVVILIKSFKQ